MPTPIAPAAVPARPRAGALQAPGVPSGATARTRYHESASVGAPVSSNAPSQIPSATRSAPANESDGARHSSHGHPSPAVHESTTRPIAVPSVAERSVGASGAVPAGASRSETPHAWPSAARATDAPRADEASPPFDAEAV